MVSKFALLTNLLLASVVLAVPSSRLSARLARRRENRQSLPVQIVNEEYSNNWAGAVYDDGAGTFTSITGTFTVPAPSGPSGSSASAWVGIDGDTCNSAILQTGVDFTVGDDGSPSYSAWYEWFPDNAYDFEDFNINTGDTITVTVTASSTTAGVATIQNESTGQQVTQNLQSSSALCGQNAEWIVEDFQENGGLVPFANFGTVTFNDATASGPGGTYSPSGANIIDIQQNGQVLTSSSASGSSVTVTYQ